mmetsp:Transcript_32822/g.107185  ORF Transcript_32822/g.107185 Transcript_32822/m.107185 type:complete len:205 (-) Transcript_32822:50-664(-)
MFSAARRLRRRPLSAVRTKSSDSSCATHRPSSRQYTARPSTEAAGSRSTRVRRAAANSSKIAIQRKFETTSGSRSKRSISHPRSLASGGAHASDAGSQAARQRTATLCPSSGTSRETEVRYGFSKAAASASHRVAAAEYALAPRSVDISEEKITLSSSASGGSIVVPALSHARTLAAAGVSTQPTDTRSGDNMARYHGEERRSA